MATALAYIHWENLGELSSSRPLVFSSRQERLHELQSGDWLWLVSRNPADNQYYIVARLPVTRKHENPAHSIRAERFGRYGVEADSATSQFFGTDFPADGLLRALLFQTAKPIKYGASIGQSLQTIRLPPPVMT